MGDNVFSSASLDFDKGQRIRFIAGTHFGKKGWLRKSKQARSDYQTYVLLELDAATVKKTYVENDNYILLDDDQEPSSFVEIVLLEHPKIEKDLTSLVRKYAQFDLEPVHVAEITQYFGVKLQQAVDNQRSKGSRALFKKLRAKFRANHSEQAENMK